MRVTVLGGCGAWPEAGLACSGFLVEHDGFRLLADLGYAALPQLLRTLPADQVDAVFISHGHPDHCADLNPLLRARALRDHPPAALPVCTLPGALDAVLALDRPPMLDGACELREFTAGDAFTIGPFQADTRPLPHWLPNAGLRLTAGGQALMYTGDSGPSPHIAELADGADLLIAESSYPEHVPGDSRGNLSSARESGQQATRAGAARLLLTHLMPGTSHQEALDAARATCDAPIDVAVPGLAVELGG